MRMLTGFGDTRGVILPMTLIILLVLATMATTLLALGVSEPQIAANVMRSVQALSLAEAGAERAIAYFAYDATGKNRVNNACPEEPPTPCPGSTTTLWSDVSLDVGKYTVKWTPVSFATVLIESTGTTDYGGVRRTVRVVVTGHYTSRFGVLGAEVEIEGNARVVGNVGAVHGNVRTDFTAGNAAFIERTATSSTATCTGCTTPCGPCDPANPASKGVGEQQDSGGNKPEEPLPTVKPLDFRARATILFGGETASSGPPVPSSCGGSVTHPGTGSPTTYVPPNYILNTQAIGSVAACTLTAANTGILSGWTMGEPGDWSFSGGTTPPDGAYYASRRIQVTASPGSPTMPWKATFVAGGAEGGSAEGEVQITGHPNIESYLGGTLMVAGEIEIEGTGGSASLKGTVISTAPNKPAVLGEVRFKGSATLIGNIIANGEVEAGGNTTVRYNVAGRTGLRSSKLQVVFWSAN